MASTPHVVGALLLGASGRLGRMMLCPAARAVLPDLDILPVSRTKDTLPGAVVWSPGQATDDLPRARSVVALWGVLKGDAEALHGNVTLASAAMTLADAIGAERVLHASSAAVYAPGPEPLTEDDVPAPVSPYGKAKAEMEREVMRISALSRVESCLMRIANVAGADMLFGNMTPGRPVRLDRFPDGTGPRRSYIGPIDLAKVIGALCVTKTLPSILNVAAPRPTAMADLARAADCPITWAEAPPSAHRAVCLNTARLQSLCPLSENAASASRLVAEARQSGVWP